MADRAVEHDLAVAAHAELERGVDAAAVEVERRPQMRSTCSALSPTVSGSASAPRTVAASRSSGSRTRRSSGSPISGKRGIVGTAAANATVALSI